MDRMKAYWIERSPREQWMLGVMFALLAVVILWLGVARPLTHAQRSARDALREATVRFQKVMTDNERALRAARSVSERLLKAIVAAVSEKQVSAAAYSSAGVLNNAGPRRAVAMTLNKQL